VTPPSGTSTQADPTLATATPAGWRAWAAHLLTAGSDRLAALGLALVLGFGAGLVTLYSFASLASTVAAGGTERLDFAVLLWLREFQSPTLDSIAWFCSLLGSELLAVFLALLLGLFAMRRRWGAGVALLVVTVGAQLENNLLKDLFQRTRPAPITGLIPAQAFSFPSGHAMVAAAFYAFVAYLSWRLLRGWLRVACVVALALVVLLIGASRLYLGVHYLTDVVAGFLAGLFWANAVALGGSLLARRRRPGGT
jgi:undecaprenyl-diphosphatase